MQKKEVLFHNCRAVFECCTEGELKINTKIMLLFEKSKKESEE